MNSSKFLTISLVTSSLALSGCLSGGGGGFSSGGSNAAPSNPSNPVNQTPVSMVFNVIGSLDVEEGDLVRLSLMGIDLSGNDITYSCVSGCVDGMEFDAENKIFSWQTDIDSAGTYPVTFIADNGSEQKEFSGVIKVLDKHIAPDLYDANGLLLREMRISQSETTLRSHFESSFNSNSNPKVLTAIALTPCVANSGLNEFCVKSYNMENAFHINDNYFSDLANNIPFNTPYEVRATLKNISFNDPRIEFIDQPEVINRSIFAESSTIMHTVGYKWIGFQPELYVVAGNPTATAVNYINLWNEILANKDFPLQVEVSSPYASKIITINVRFPAMDATRAGDAYYYQVNDLVKPVKYSGRTQLEVKETQTVTEIFEILENNPTHNSDFTAPVNLPAGATWSYAGSTPTTIAGVSYLIYRYQFQWTPACSLNDGLHKFTVRSRDAHNISEFNVEVNVKHKNCTVSPSVTSPIAMPVITKQSSVSSSGKFVTIEIPEAYENEDGEVLVYKPVIQTYATVARGCSQELIRNVVIAKDGRSLTVELYRTYAVSNANNSYKACNHFNVFFELDKSFRNGVLVEEPNTFTTLGTTGIAVCKNGVKPAHVITRNIVPSVPHTYSDNYDSCDRMLDK